MAVFPSDHDIRHEAAFRRHVHRMVEVIESRPDDIALLGARPDQPESGYGYLAPGRRLDGFDGVFRVSAFREKPARQFASRILRRGGLWNSFVMVARAERLRALLYGVRPHDVARLAPLGHARSHRAHLCHDGHPAALARSWLRPEGADRGQ